MYPAQRGRVIVQDRGNFYAEGEVLHPDPEQLPQFLPRTEWPRDPTQGRQHRPQGKYLDGPWIRGDVSPPDQIAVRDRVARGYPQLVPMPPFQHQTSHSGHAVYNNSVWPDHVAILHGLLRQTLRGAERPSHHRRWLDGDEIVELLTCLTYGMNHSTLVLHPWTLAGPPRAGGKGSKNRMPFAHMEAPEFPGHAMAQGSYENPWASQPFADEMRQKMLGRRWIIAPINQVDVHWSISLFDRQHGHLYIFDTADFSRAHRIRATVHLWARFWKALDMPWHFHYFVAPTTPQPCGWECGLLTVQWILMTLRNRVGGVRLEAADTSIDTHDFSLLAADRVPDDFPLVDSSLSIPDWVPLSSHSPKTGLVAVIRLTKVLICNELGLYDEDVFIAHDGRESVSPFDRIVDKFRGATGRVQVRKFFTGEGGLQFSKSQTSKSLPYRTRDAHINRAHRPVHDEDGVIDFRPEALAAVPPQRGLVQFPQPDPAPVEDWLYVRSIQQLDELAEEGTYPVEVQLGDRRDPDRALAPMVIDIAQWTVAEGSNQVLQICFSLMAAFPQQPAEQRPRPARMFLALPDHQQLVLIERAEEEAAITESVTTSEDQDANMSGTSENDGNGSDSPQVSKVNKTSRSPEDRLSRIPRQPSPAVDCSASARSPKRRREDDDDRDDHHRESPPSGGSQSSPEGCRRTKRLRREA
ncbi:hypothetical protein ACRE_006990 [Hapsidospora chrysogenum ATCC 11550]|uniref:Ubiquitin-like protease family profile domain-containing protein n=1 Tax=Hapsidospora chrysogenum (strain ATCC 11550 / CBS 779.69 / DSM 880 / IAM 14645 / JCM 23072 / IMI 49137) TaxID=857340 RepID=A0A086TGJ8_HAPC1|nr:hypothetical protein ACRE_006990 [Hapsidospora chrysogenum ATCC 11550]